MTIVQWVEIDLTPKNYLLAKKREILIAPYIENPYNPGWSRDHPGFYEFSMYGGSAHIILMYFHEFLNALIFYTSGVN